MSAPITLPEGLPQDLQIAEVLSRSERADVLRVRRKGASADAVLRLASSASTAVEAELALFARLNAAGLVAPEQWGRSTDGRAWLLRPFIEGRTFAAAATAASTAEVAAWTRSVLATLAALHDAGWLHRDVKSANVIVGPRGVFLVDLDLAGSAAAAPAGSPWHLAPEVLLGLPPAPRSDLFALGAMLALAFCGAPSPEFHAQFPARSFWQASRLDPERLPRELAGLVQALVRRHPEDRPSSARAALALLDPEGGAAGDVPEPPRQLPFLAGRETALSRLVGLNFMRGDRDSALVTVRDAEELPDVADQVQFALALAGCRAERLGAGAALESPERSALRLRAAAVDVAVLVLTRDDDVERGLALLLAAARGGPGVVLVAGPEPAHTFTLALQQRGLQAEIGGLTLVPWPRVPRAALEQHLRRLTGAASPELAAALAAHLHERTAGRLADVNRLLSRAVDDNVLRADGALYTLLRADWPQHETSGASLTGDFSALPDAQRSALCALAVIGTPAEPATLRAVASAASESDERSTDEALHALVTHGLLQRDGSGAIRARDPRLLEAARASLDRPSRTAWHRRCMDVLAMHEQGSTTRAAWASHASAVAQTAAEWRAVLDVADAELAAGRLAPSRALLQAARAASAGGASGAAAAGLDRRLALLDARLELAQGRARDALSVLARALGEDLSGAAPDELLVAAHAAEQAGRRDDARRWLERVLAAPENRAQALDARRGLGYAAWLEGRWQSVLDILGDEPREDDPEEPAAAVLNLRGVACVRLQRWQDAEKAFAQALVHCGDGRHPLWRARTELNTALLDRRRGRTEQAIAALRRAESAFDAAGHVSGRALALHNLGVLHRDRGELSAARELLQDALALRRRTGDAHGVAATLGSLALLRFDAGQAGAALAELEAAREKLAGGAYAAETSVLELHRAMALALLGRHVDAAGALALVTTVGPADVDEQAALRARATALVRACAGEMRGAEHAVREACRTSQAAGDFAELFRAASLLCVLAPGDESALAAMADAAHRLGSTVRDAEIRWRTMSSRAARSPDDAAALRGLLACFESSGRTDLVRAVSQELVRAADAAGDLDARRAAAARAAEATDALTDALSTGAREATLQRVSRWFGGESAAVAAPVALAPDAGGEARARTEAAMRGLDVAWLLTCNRRMAAEDDLNELLLRIVDTALELTGARRGFVVLLEGDAVQVQVARGMDRAAMPEDEMRFSLTVVKDAIASRRAVVTTDAAADSRFRGTQSITSFKLRSVLCVPLALPAPLAGALYLDNDQRASAFDDTDAERVGWLADQAALAIGNLRRRAELQAQSDRLRAQATEIEALNRRLAERVQTQEHELSAARTLLRQRGTVSPAPGMVGDSDAMQRVYTLIDRLGPTELGVLVTGPSGTGKDLVARALHARSRRADKALVIENVAALPASLLESELFGHVRGAFTGADRDRPGLFTEADGGTFFLDEIGDMPLELQAKLLRVLETGEMRPVGARRNVRVDVRIVAATHRDLLARVREGAFREDLYYRLNAAEIRLPPLSERLDDIPLLVAHFLARLNEKHGTTRQLREPVLRALVRRAWPGQVRELANEVSRLYFLSNDVIDDPSLVREPAAPRGGDATGGEAGAVGGASVSLKLDDAERAALQRALTASGGRKDRAAQLLGISRAGLYAKLKRLGLAADDGG